MALRLVREVKRAKHVKTCLAHSFNFTPLNFLCPRIIWLSSRGDTHTSMSKICLPYAYPTMGGSPMGLQFIIVCCHERCSREVWLVNEVDSLLTVIGDCSFSARYHAIVIFIVIITFFVLSLLV